MIGIQLEGGQEFLDTPPDISITVRLENPVLTDDDKISKGSFSYPFRLPGGSKSERNSRMLKNPDVIENSEAYQIQKAMLFASSAPDSNVIPFKKGNLKSLDSETDSINCFFQFGLSTISDEFKTAKLRDVIDENFLISNSAIYKKVYLKSNTGSYNIVINGKTHTAADLDSIVASINAEFNASLDSGKYMPSAGKVTGGTTPSGLITGNYAQIGMAIYYTADFLGVPTPSILASADPLHELHITTDTPSDYQIEADLGTYYSEFTTFMSGYISGSYPNSKLRFPVMLNANPFAESGIKEGELVNGVNSSGFIKNDPNWGLLNSKPFQVKNYNSILPVLRRKWILDKIATEFDFTWDGDFYEHADLENMLEYNTAALDVAMGFIGDKKFVFWKRSFNLRELVPDITVVEYLRRLKMRYNLAIYFNEQTQRVRISSREAIAQSPAYSDVTSLSTPSSGNSDERSAGYALMSKKDDNDALSIQEKVVVGSPTQEIITECGRIYQQSGDVIEGMFVYAPRVSQNWGTGDQLRTFYFKGMVDAGTFDYPGADITGTVILESLENSFTLEGLYNKFWKYWLHYQRRRKIVKLRISFPLRMLVKFDWELKQRFNRVNYLVKGIDVTITNQGVTVNSVDLYTMN